MFLHLTAVLVLSLNSWAIQDSKSQPSFSPPAEVKKLDFLAGNWSVDQKAYMPGSTTAQTSNASVQCQWVLQGRFMSYRYQADIPGMGNLQGLLLFTYDPDAKTYRSWWFDSTSSQVSESEGHFEGSKLIMVSKPEEVPGMGVISMRTTLEPKANKEIYFLLETKMGEKWEKMLEADFKKSEAKPGNSKNNPSADMKKLEFLLGAALGKEKMLMPGQSMEYNSETNAEWLMGGAYIGGIYKADVPSYGKMEGLMLITYDSASKKYHCRFFANTGALPMEMSGQLEGTKLVLVSKPYKDMMGMNTYRVTFDSNLNNSPNYRMDMKSGEKWTPILESTYKKK
jgi:hypothetical protein